MASLTGRPLQGPRALHEPGALETQLRAAGLVLMDAGDLAFTLDPRRARPEAGVYRLAHEWRCVIATKASPSGS